MSRKARITYTGSQQDRPTYNESALSDYRRIFDFETPIYPRGGSGGYSSETKKIIKSNFDAFTEDFFNSIDEAYLQKKEELNKMIKDGFITPATAEDQEKQFIEKELMPLYERIDEVIQNDPRAAQMLEMDSSKIDTFKEKADKLYYGSGTTSSALKSMFGSEEDKSITRRRDNIRERLDGNVVQLPDGQLDYVLPETTNDLLSDEYKQIPIAIYTEDGYVVKNFDEVYKAYEAGDVFTRKDDNGVDKFFLVETDKDGKSFSYIPDSNGVPTKTVVVRKNEGIVLDYEGVEYVGDTLPAINKDIEAMSENEKEDYFSKAKKPVDGMWVEDKDGKAYLMQGGELKYSPTIDIANAHGYDPRKVRKDFTIDEIDAFKNVAMFDNQGNVVGLKEPAKLEYPMQVEENNMMSIETQPIQSNVYSQTMNPTEYLKRDTEVRQSKENQQPQIIPTPTQQPEEEKQFKQSKSMGWYNNLLRKYF